MEVLQSRRASRSEHYLTEHHQRTHRSSSPPPPPPPAAAATVAAAAARHRAAAAALAVGTMSLLLVNLAAILERADEGLLPAVYREVGAAFGASPSQLGTLTFIRALVQALSSPLAGAFAVRHDRAVVIGAGTIFWALTTGGVGLAQTYWACAAWRALNGVGLAIVVPAVQSFIADSYPESQRGVGFGLLNLVGAMGSVGGSMAATMLAGRGTVLGVPGWRLAFLLMAVVSVAIGLLVLMLVKDPRHTKQPLAITEEGRPLLSSSAPSAPALSSLLPDMLQSVRRVWGIPTFKVIIAQGVLGSLPWQAMVFFTMWLQLVGFGHDGAALLMAIFTFGCALGALIGGWLGDKLAMIWPKSGRIMCAQFSAFMGIPFTWLVLVGLPPEKGQFKLFAAAFLAGGLMISWCQSCANNPIFSEIVPLELRTAVYALDRALEGAVAALAAPAVGIFAERFFGYRADHLVPETGSPSEARALAKGLFSCMAPPFALCALTYGILYWTYGKDRKEAGATIELEELKVVEKRVE